MRLSLGLIITALLWHLVGPFHLKSFILKCREFSPYCFSDFSAPSVSLLAELLLNK